MATFSLDATGRSSAELLAFHAAMAKFDGRAEIRAVHGFWRAGEGPYVELVFEDGRRERVEFTIAATAAA